MNEETNFTPSPKRIGKGRPRTLDAAFPSSRNRASSAVFGKPPQFNDSSGLDPQNFDARRASAPAPISAVSDTLACDHVKPSLDPGPCDRLPTHDDSVSRHNERIAHISSELPRFPRTEPLPLIQELARMQRRDVRHVQSLLDVDDLVACYERDLMEAENIHAVKNGLMASSQGGDLSVFGAKLRTVAMYAAVPVPFGHYQRSIPYVAMACIEELYRRGLNEPRLFCATNNREALLDLITRFDSFPYFGKNVDLYGVSTECICSLLTTFLSGLPEPPITFSFLEPLWLWCLRPFLEEDMQYSEQRTSLVERVMTRKLDLHERVCIQIAKTLLRLLPSANLSLLLYVMTFLNQVHRHGMAKEDISVLFGPSVFGARKGDARSDARATLIMCWVLHRWDNISASYFGMPSMYSVDSRDRIPSNEWVAAPSNIRQSRIPLRRKSMTKNITLSSVFAQDPVLQVTSRPKADRVVHAPIRPLPSLRHLRAPMDDDVVVLSPCDSSGSQVTHEVPYSDTFLRRGSKELDDAVSAVSRTTSSSSVDIRSTLKRLGSDPPQLTTLTIAIEDLDQRTRSSDSSSYSSHRASSSRSSSLSSLDPHEPEIGLFQAKIRITQLERELSRCDEVVADAIQETFEERKRADALEKQVRMMQESADRRNELLHAYGVGIADEPEVMIVKLEEALLQKDEAVKEKEKAKKRLGEFEKLISVRDPDTE